MSWQPIETAPRDGTILLLARVRTEIPEIGAWSEHHKAWAVLPAPNEKIKGQSALLLTGRSAPTHWMPLPDPPENPSDD